MNVIIPYREVSERCKFKNTRDFNDGKSLLEVTIEHLDKEVVSLACVPTESAIYRAKAFGVNSIALSEHTLTGNWSNLALDIVSNIDYQEPICFMFCTNPVFFRFNDIKETLLVAEENVRNGSGSAMVVYPLRHYILDDKMQGVNHGQGFWHRYSQDLPQWYINPWVLIVTTVQAVKKYGYWYTPDVKPIYANGPCIDIDTEEDFQLAKKIYSI